MIEMTSRPWMGGLWGREGVHPGTEVKRLAYAKRRSHGSGI